jgi:hypothetical protein
MFKPLDSRRSKHHFFIGIDWEDIMAAKITIYGKAG